MTDIDSSNDRAYDLLLALEQLESLREEMTELGVDSADELARLPPAEAAAVLAELRDLGLDSLAAVTARIDELHHRLDALDAPPQ